MCVCLALWGHLLYWRLYLISTDSSHHPFLFLQVLTLHSKITPTELNRLPHRHACSPLRAGGTKGVLADMVPVYGHGADIACVSRCKATRASSDLLLRAEHRLIFKGKEQQHIEVVHTEHKGNMIWKFVLSCLAGGLASSRCAANVSLALDPPTLDAIMDPALDEQPIRAVVIGGGYSGSRIAYQFDSLFDVTFVDEKNFFELSNDVIPILANPWVEDKHPEAIRRMTSLHRFYLKRANVVTGTVDGVDEEHVYLQDGRTVPYDLLVVATGEQKPFPLQTQQRTLSGRVQELRQFNSFMQQCKKVAVVGGGPVGTSLAHDLATSRPDLDVHLFHSRRELMPVLPGVCRRYALEKIEQSPNLHVHLSTRVVDVQGIDVHGVVVPSEAPTRSRWLSWVLPPPKMQKPSTFNVIYDILQCDRKQQQSILSQAYFGTQDTVNEGVVVGHGTEGDFDYVFPTGGDTPRPIVAGHGKPNILAAHETPTGHYRASIFQQLFGYPHIFAVGRCNSLPLTRSYGTSDVEVRTLFRALSSAVSKPSFEILDPSDGLQLHRMKVPRLHVRLGGGDAVACTPWSGGLTGISAVNELMQDRAFLMREFKKPLFYKMQDPAKVRQRILAWKSKEITDIVDFSQS